MESIGKALENHRINSSTDTTDNTDKVIYNHTDITDITSKDKTRTYGFNNYQYECDQLYEYYKDLCGDTRFRAYYINAFYKLGRSRVEIIAAQAKERKSPAKAFGWLISEALNG